MTKDYSEDTEAQQIELKRQIANDFSDCSVLSDLEGATVLQYDYTYENYSGDAHGIYEKDGKYYTFGGGHCSCYGLEGQWSPDEMSTEAIAHIAREGTLFGDKAKDILKAIGYGD